MLRRLQRRAERGIDSVRERIATSTDGGDSWRTQVVQKNTSASSGKDSLISGTSGCTIRTDSEGNVYAFSVRFSQQTKQQGLYMTRSFTVGRLRGRASGLLGRRHRNVGSRAGPERDGRHRRCSSDLSVAPSVDIANDSPTGADATDQIVMSWVDGSGGLNHEHLMFSTSANGGEDWTEPSSIEVSE